MACDYNIELIFKSWKSDLHFASIKTVKAASTLCYLEGVSELWICSPMRAQEKNGSLQDGANVGFPKGGMAHTATAPIAGARGKHRQASPALAVERPQAKAGPGCGSRPRPGKPPTAQRRGWRGP